MAKQLGRSSMFGAKYPEFVKKDVNLLFSQYPGRHVMSSSELFRDILYYLWQNGIPYPESRDNYATGSDERLAQLFAWSPSGEAEDYVVDAFDIVHNMNSVVLTLTAKYTSIGMQPYPGLALRDATTTPVGKKLKGISLPGTYYAVYSNVKSSPKLQTDGIVGHWELRDRYDNFAPLEPRYVLRKFKQMKVADTKKAGNWINVWQDYT